jgi:Tol biopolymer transport system component
VETGEIRKPVTVEQVVQEYGNWVQQKFGTTDISIFFPVLSPDGSKVFFKLSRPSGGDDFRSKQASLREGKVVYDLADNHFIRLFVTWGHPSWDPHSKAIFEKGNILDDLATGSSVRFARSSPSNHPTLSPDGKVFVTDADVSRRDFGKPGDWAIVVGDTSTDRFVVVAQFNNTGGAKSWRRSHPHPAFSVDGRRIYYNVSEGDQTRLFVAESAVATASTRP